MTEALDAGPTLLFLLTLNSLKSSFLNVFACDAVENGIDAMVEVLHDVHEHTVVRM